MMSKPFDLRLGDCLETLKSIPDNSVDSCVTDPPYGLSQHSQADIVKCLQAWLSGEKYQHGKAGFMNRNWDSFVPGPEVWREVLRVLKPGGHLLAFAGTRSMDLMSMAVRLAGFELRDAVGYANDGGGAPLAAWCYGSGFPKSMDVSKAIDKAAGAERTEVVGVKPGHEEFVNRTDAHAAGGKADGWDRPWKADADAVARSHMVMAPATDAARQWSGWGTALKPAWEPIIMARKPLIGTVAQNVLEHGTGALNIDGCRVALTGDADAAEFANNHAVTERLPQHYDGQNLGLHEGGWKQRVGPAQVPEGRWPANVITDGSEEVVAMFPQQTSGSRAAGVRSSLGSTRTFSAPGKGDGGPAIEGSTGSAARFFYCAKASKRDRDEGLDGFDVKDHKGYAGATISGRTMVDGEWVNTENARQPRANIHPTVKPTDLMAYLVRLVTPQGGVVLDPFLGSGSTGKAAIREGFRFVGCELSPEYLEIARARIEFEVAKIEAAAATAAAAAPAQRDLFAVA